MLLNRGSQQLVELLDETAEVLQGGVDGLGLLHVDAGVAQQVERKLGAAAFQKAEIVIQFGLAAAQHALRQRDGRRHAGRVLVNVKRPIEMRDAQALERQLVVEREVRAEVFFQQFAIDRLERLDRQGLAGFGHVVGDFFELGEHRLPDDRAADVVDFAVEQIGPLLVVGGVLEHVVREQFLVERAGHFGDGASTSNSCASNGRPRA